MKLSYFFRIWKNNKIDTVIRIIESLIHKIEFKIIKTSLLYSVFDLYLKKANCQCKNINYIFISIIN